MAPDWGPFLSLSRSERRSAASSPGVSPRPAALRMRAERRLPMALPETATDEALLGTIVDDLNVCSPLAALAGEVISPMRDFELAVTVSAVRELPLSGLYGR